VFRSSVRRSGGAKGRFRKSLIPGYNRGRPDEREYLARGDPAVPDNSQTRQRVGLASQYPLSLEGFGGQSSARTDCTAQNEPLLSPAAGAPAGQAGRA